MLHAFPMLFIFIASFDFRFLYLLSSDESDLLDDESDEHGSES